MAIGLYDGNAFQISGCESIQRSHALSFFLNGHIDDALVLHDTDGAYCGIITYKSLLKCHTIQEAVVRDTLILEEGKGEAFWQKAQELIQNSNDSMIPVFHPNMELLYFAKFNSKLHLPERKLQFLQNCFDKDLWKNFKEYNRHIHITGMSDVSYFLRKWLCSLGAQVSVEGTSWRLLGIKETPCPGKEAIIVNDECSLLDSIHRQYVDLLEKTMPDDVSKLKKLLIKPMKQNTGKKIVLFHLTYLSFFAESIFPLVSYYIDHGVDCVAIFSELSQIIPQGKNNVTKIISLIEKIELLGGRCYSIQTPEVLEQEYDICFVCSEYSGNLPPINTRCLVSLQTTATYTHMYTIKGDFEEVFSEQARAKTDYLVTSEFIADWICEKNRKWEPKILKFGYPKLDTLYHSLKAPEIPDDWYNKTKGKKVLLLAGEELPQKCWDLFEQNNHLALIWRPHPLSAEITVVRKELEKRSNMENVIIDRSLSYYAAFQLSDALIVNGYSSVTTNYLFLNKPICIIDDESQKMIINYRQEAWYKSAYPAFQDEDIVQFIHMVSNGKDYNKAQQEPYRQLMINHFDGRVCERIYNYFEHIL